MYCSLLISIASLISLCTFQSFSPLRSSTFIYSSVKCNPILLTKTVTRLYLSKQNVFDSKMPRSANSSTEIKSYMILLDDVDALFLDCDGTIAETEKDLTLLQFNKAFQSIPSLSHIQWTPDEYGELLKAGVSQFRFQAYFEKNGYPSTVPDDSESRKRFCYDMKILKDDMFHSVWTSENIPIRPGILKIVQEAIARDVFVAVCSNSNTIPVSSICSTLFGPELMSKILVIGGDYPQLKNKKPFPDIYLLAASFAAKYKGVDSVPSRRCLVIEDSQVGLQAAVAADMRCVITPSYYTINEDFTGAEIVTASLDLLL